MSVEEQAALLTSKKSNKDVWSGRITSTRSKFPQKAPERQQWGERKAGSLLSRALQPPGTPGTIAGARWRGGVGGSTSSTDDSGGINAARAPVLSPSTAGDWKAHGSQEACFSER